jgi:hypothetical protein
MVGSSPGYQGALKIEVPSVHRCRGVMSLSSCVGCPCPCPAHVLVLVLVLVVVSNW